MQAAKVHAAWQAVRRDLTAQVNVRPNSGKETVLTDIQSAASSAEVIERSHSITQPRRMVPAEQSALFLRYPLFFRAVAAADAHPSNLRNFGIQCGIGWYPLIEEAAAQIESELRQMLSDQLMQWENIAALEHAILKEQTGSAYPVLPACTEIREVNGALAIVLVQGFVSAPEQWQRLKDIAQVTKEKSRSICEKCGAPGQMRATYWRHVYCEDCIAPIGTLDLQAP